MHLKFNGKEIHYQKLTLVELLCAQKIHPEMQGMAVAVNECIVKREAWKFFYLNPGDRIEVVYAVQGG